MRTFFAFKNRIEVVAKCDKKLPEINLKLFTGRGLRFRFYLITFSVSKFILEMDWNGHCISAERSPLV